MIERRPMSEGEVELTFRLPADHPAEPIGVAGDFNGWEVTPLVDGGGKLEAAGCGHAGAADLAELGRLDVERSFEVRGTRSEPGRMYASGSATNGGYFPGVDTFLGLQIAAQEIADDLEGLGFCARLGPVRSTRQWWRWARGRKI